MKFIQPSVTLLDITQNALQKIEAAGRTCYKSEDKITDESANSFVEAIMSKNHESVLEHAYASFRIVCDRGISHEIVRHRIASYSQESQRYVGYDKDKFGGEITFIIPSWVKEPDKFLEIVAYLKDETLNIPEPDFLEKEDEDGKMYSNYFDLISYCINAESNYLAFRENGLSPQEARCILPNCTKTEIVMTANFREWKHFLEMRCSKAAHPDMQIIANQIKVVLNEKYPVIFSL